MATNVEIKNLIQKADNHALRTVLMSSVSAITLSACMGGGGGGTFGIYGSSSSGARLDMASRLVKGTVVGARVFQDVDGDGVFDDDGTENFAFTDSSGAYSLELNNLTSNITVDSNRPGIDITTGAAPGKIVVNPVNATGLVSTPLSFLGDEYGSTNLNSVLTNMPSGIDVSTYDPIDEIKAAGGDNTSNQYQTAEQVDALAAQTQVIINSIEKMLSSETVATATGDTTPLSSAKKSIIDGYTAKGSALDLGDASDVQTILNASPLSSVSGFENIISSLSTAIASVNTQIWTTQDTGDLFGDGRSIMLVAQDSLGASVAELAASPSDSVAGQIAEAYSGSNLNSLKTAAADSLPTFNPATGVGANVLPSIDRATVTLGEEVTVNVLANDVALDGAALSVTAISSTNVKDGNGLSPLMSAVDNTASINPINSALSSASSNLAVLNSDGTITFTPEAVGRYTIFYQVYDGANPAVGSLVIDSNPAAPTISSPNTIELTERKDGNVGDSTDTAVNFQDLITVTSSGVNGAKVLLSYRITDNNAVYKGIANERGDASENTNSINRGSADAGFVVASDDGSIDITDRSVLSNLKFTFNREYSGEFNIEFQVVETLNNRFVSSETVSTLVKIAATSDTPTLTVANATGVEDDAFIPLTVSSSSTDTSETVTVYVENPSQVVKFINTTTNVEVGTSASFDFGSGSVSAIALTNSELSNLGIVTGGDVKTNFNLKVMASSLDSGTSTAAKSSLSTIAVSMEAKADPVNLQVNNSSSSNTLSNSDENSAISIPIKLNLNDATENITLSIGNFRDSSGNLLSTDRSLETAFRPTGFDDVSTISLNNGFFTFNSVSMSNLVSDAIAGNQFTVNFLPITNFNGLITFDVYATSIEPNAVTSSNASSQTSVITLTQNIDPVSQTPEVSVTDASVVEFTNDSSVDNVATYKTDLSNISVSLSDTTNLTEVKVALSVANDPGFTLDTSGVTTFNSSYNYIVSATSPLSIKVNGTVADGSSLGTDLVADMTTLLSQVKLVPPEDYSGTSTITTSVTSKETGAEESQPATQTFDIAVSAVAQTPAVTGSAATSATLKEDTDILLDLNVTVNDKDGSETVSQVRISGLTSIGEQNLTGILVDGNGNLIGSNDGSGTTILTSAEYSAARAGTTPIFFRPPRDFSGDVSLNIIAVVQEPSSGSTGTSATSSINFTLTPVSEEASASSNDVSVVEFTNTSVDNDATYKTDLSNITVSLSDTSNLGEVKVALSVAKDPDGLVDNETLGAAGNFLIDGTLSSASSSNLNSTVNISSTSNNASVTFTITGTDASGNAQTETITGVNNNTVEGTKYFKTITQISSDAAASGVNVGASPGFTLDTSGVTTFNSSYNYTVSTTSPLSIKVNGTVADGSSVGADLVADMTTLLSELKLVPPEDFSGTATISTSVTSTETGAGESPAANDSFEITVSAVAEAPEITGSAASSATLKEDTDILLDLNVTIKDSDASETVSQVRISGLTSIGEQNLTGMLVDGNGNLVGSSDGSGTTILTSAEYTAARAGTAPIFFRPPTDFSGKVELNVVAVVQEPTSGSTATSATSTFDFTLAPVSETPEISLNDVSVVEFTNDSNIDNAATYKTNLSNITVNLSDTSNLDEVKVSFSIANDPGFTLDTSGVTTLNLSTYNFTVNPTSPLSVMVNGTKADGSSIGSDLVADMTTLLSEIKLVPPEDYSGTSTITTSVTSTETGADESQAATQNFNITVSPVAETPTVTINSPVNGSEDLHTSLKIDSSIITATSGDSSETISSYQISGLSVGGVNYSLVDVSGNAVGSSDGSGTTTITSAQFSSGVYLKAPSDMHGIVTLQVVAVSKDGVSSTASSSPSTFTVNISPVADTPTVSVPDLSTAINIVENDGTNYSTSAINGISLNSNVVSNNDDETLNIYVAFEKATDGSQAVVISGSTLTPMTTSQISALDSATTAKLPSYNYSLFSLSSIDDLSNLTFNPPVSHVENSYGVRVIATSTDVDAALSTTDYKSEAGDITYNILQVAKAPIVTLNDSDIDTSNVNAIADLTKTNQLNSNLIEIPLEIAAQGLDTVTVLISGLPSDDFVFKDSAGADGNIVGARNSTGTVYVFNLGDGFVVEDGGNFSLYVDPTFDVTQGGTISNTGTADNPEFNYSLNLAVTAFAIDGSGAGTTASTQFNLGNTITKNNLLANDPLIIDFKTTSNVDGLNDNFSVNSRNFDLNADGLNEKVFLPDSDIGIMFYAPSTIEDGSLLSMKDNIFSENFEYNNAKSGTSLGAMRLLDSNSDGVINNQDAEFAKIGYWRDGYRDGNLDGLVKTGETGEIYFLTGSDSINLNNFTFSNTAIDGSSSSQVEGYISRQGNISISGNNYDTYEVALGLDVAAVQNQTGNQFTADIISFSDNSLELSEGLSEGSLGLSLTKGTAESVYGSATVVTLVTLSGIPDAVILSQGVKQANGDWLLLGSQIDPEVPISFVAADTDFSGNFIVSGWATTTVIDGADTYTATSASKTMTVNVQAVIDDVVFEAFNSTGFEDGGRDNSGAVIQDGKTKSQIVADKIDGPIPVVIRYGVGDKDGSEKAKLVLEIDEAMVGTDGGALKFVYHDGSAFKYISNDKLDISSADGTTTYTFTNINSINDPIIKGLHLIPQSDHVPSNGIDITAKMFVSDSGIDFTQKATKTIKVEIIDRADVFPVTFTGTLSGTAENAASSSGITLISTKDDGTYEGITSGGKAVTTSNFDGWIIGIKNPDTTLTDGKYDAFSKSYNEIMLKVGDALYNAKTSANNAELVFNIPSSNLHVDGKGYDIKLVTPEYFDSSLDLTFKTLSQGGAGDVAISSATDRSVPIYSIADGVKTLEVTGADSSGNIVGVEDGPAIRLSVKVAREDLSENITQVKLTGKESDFGISRNVDTPNDTSNVVYLTRVETRPLDKFTSDVLSNLSGVNLTDAATLDLDQARTQSFDGLKEGSLSLTLKIAGGYGTKVPNFAKDQSISTLAELKAALESDFAGQYALLLREANPTGDIFYGLKWEGSNLVADNPGSDATIETAGHWAKKEFMENDFGSNVTRSENGDNVEYVINIEGQAKALVDANSQLENTAANYQQAEDFIARNIGIKSSPDVSGEKSLTYVVTTVDKDNPQNANSPSSKDESVSISLDISGRADVFPVTFTGTLSGTAENAASSSGITLISTKDDGTYEGITSGGKAVTTSNFDGWIIGIKNPDTTLTDGKYDAFSKSYNEIMLKVGDALYNAKTSANNAELVFNIPSSNLHVDGKGYDIKLVTPEYFDSSLDLTFKTLSQGGAGDVAISSATDRSVPIYSIADGVKTLEVTGADSSGNIVGVEDGPAIRLSVKVAREDLSENITQVKLTGKESDFGISRNVDTPNDTSNVVYLTRVETRPLDKFTSDVLSNLSGVNLTDAATLDLDQARTQSFDGLKEGSLSLTLKIAGGYGTKVPNFAKDQSISTLAELKAALESDFAGQYALLLREANPTGDIFYGLKWEGSNLVADNPGSDATIETAGHWAKKEFMENDFGSNVTRSENGDNVEYVINIEGQAKALVDANSQLENTAANYQQAEDFIARNIGIKSSPDVSGEKSLTYVVTTVDKDNPQNANSPSSKDESVSISLDISGRADVFPVTFTGTLSGTAENAASSSGITLISTKDDGTYEGITSGGKAVTTSNFDGWIIGIKNPDTTLTDGKYDAFSKSYNEIMLKVGDALYNAKTSANNAELVFNIPSSNLHVDGKGYDIKLVTPEYFDSSLDLTFKTLSQGGAGDVAISSATDRSVPIYSIADGVKTLEVTGADSSGNIVGVEDGPAIRLSVKVAREDLSENITQVKLTGKESDFGISRNVDTPNDTSNVVYLTRVDGALKENSFGNFVKKVPGEGSNVEYIIDIEGQAQILLDEGMFSDLKKAEDFLARNIGIKISPDVSGEKSLTYAITTIDEDNPDPLISNIKTQTVELKINVKNINDLAYVDQSTVSADSTYFSNSELPFLLHKDAVIKDKEANNFFGGVLTVLIANIAGSALASERITLTKDSLYSIDGIQLKLSDKVIGSIKNNDQTGLTIEFNEYDTTTLPIINELVKDLEFYAPEVVENGSRKISLSLNDGGGVDEFGNSETIITRNLELFVGKSGNISNDEIDGSNGIQEALVGGLGVDTLVGGVGDHVNLQLEKDFYDLYSDQARPDVYFNKVNLGTDSSDTTSYLANIQSELNKVYSKDIAINFNQSYDQQTGILTISNFTSDGTVKDINSLDVLYRENMNGYTSETDLSEFIEISNNELTLNILSKAKELLVGLKSDDVKYKLEIQNVLGENGNDPIGNEALINIVDKLKSNLIIKNQISLEESFVSAGEMQLNGGEAIDKIQEIENVKGSEDNDHIFGSNKDNTIEGKSGNDVIYGGAGNDHILGGVGHDVISGGSGNDYIDGGSGNDTIYVSSGLNSSNGEGQTVIGGEGDDTLSFENINNGVLLDFVFGIGTFDEVDKNGILGADGIGEVLYFVLEGDTYHSFEKIIGSQVNDYIVNLTPWDHFMEIFGGHGNDNLIGSYGDEILSGGMGNDIISGGYGVDTLSGGEGFDKFIILDDTPTEEFKKQWVLSNPEDQANIEADNIFKSEDTIKDFKIGVDTIDLTAISNSGVDLSDNVDINDLSVKQKNEFDAVMEIKNTSTVDVSITLENFGSVSQQTEEELLQSILV